MVNYLQMGCLFRAQIISQHKRETEEIMDIIFAMEQEFEEAETEARQEFTSLRDEIKNKVGILVLLKWSKSAPNDCAKV